MRQATELLQTRAEILKLARVLGSSPDELEYLERVPLAEVRALREQVTEVLFTAHGHALERLAGASRLLPVGLVATIAERAFGPLLSARMAAMLEPGRAVEVAAKLPPGFLADVAIEMDPRRASDVIARIPARQIAEVTSELIRRGEHVTMGSFVGHLADEAIVAALEVMDDSSLLQVAFVLEDKERLERLGDLLPPERLAGVIEQAAAADLWRQALDLLGHLSEPRRREFARLAAELDHATLEAIVTTVIENHLWAQVLAIAERDAILQSKLAERVPALDRRQREAIAERARTAGVLGQLGPLGEALVRGETVA